MSNIIAYLKEDELEYIEKNMLERCEACGHLKIFHVDHCCVFCTIPDCTCRWGELNGE